MHISWKGCEPSIFKKLIFLQLQQWSTILGLNLSETKWIVYKIFLRFAIVDLNWVKALCSKVFTWLSTLVTVLDETGAHKFSGNILPLKKIFAHSKILYVRNWLCIDYRAFKNTNVQTLVRYYYANVRIS